MESRWGASSDGDAGNGRILGGGIALEHYEGERFRIVVATGKDAEVWIVDT